VKSVVKILSLMKNTKTLLSLIFILTFVSISFTQDTFVITDPLKTEKGAGITPAIEKLIKAEVFPKAKNNWEEDICPSDSEQLAGVAKGAFTKSASNQTLVLYQYCQTGNGLGNNILVLLEAGKIVKTFGSESGWAISLKWLPDINQNGIDEFAITYGGGMHQGQGGTGIDIFEFADGKPKLLGWLAESSYSEDSEQSYKVWVKKGKKPVFYREKYVNGKNNKLVKTGKSATFTLTKGFTEGFKAWN
jgi:hypothetical protein